MKCEYCGKREGVSIVDETHLVCLVCEPKFKSSKKAKKWKKKTYHTP